MVKKNIIIKHKFQINLIIFYKISQIDDRDDDRNEFKLDFETDLYQNIDEDEENDYHILSDLADFKNQPPTGVYASVNTLLLLFLL